MDTKTCPSCAEQVQAAAKVCRFCGYDFSRRRNPNFTKGDAAGCAVTGCAVWLFWPIVVILLLVAIGSMLPSAAKEPAASPSPESQVQPGEVNQAALDALFPQEKKKRHTP